MTRILFSFLGKVAKNGYRTANYDFGNGRTQENRYFGLAILDHLKTSAAKRSPDRFVVLGTSGSMWDVFLEHLASEGRQDSEMADLWALLTEKARDDAVDQAALDRLRPILEAFTGIQCRPVLIPYCRDLEEQIALLHRMGDLVDRKDRVTLDLTHGLRHLPLMGLVAALLFETVRRARVESIYYGALEMARDGLTPVVDLGGLLHAVRWLAALQTLDKDGDYGVLVKPLQRDRLRPEVAKLLEQAAHHEKVLQLGKARSRVNTNGH